MAKNKKPRKAYKPQQIRPSGCHYPQEFLDKVRSLINDTLLVVEFVLLKGTATDEHILKVQDLLNWGSVMLFDRKWPGQEEEIKAFLEEHHKALNAYSQIIKRKNEGLTSDYIATPEELAVLQDVCGQIGDLLKEGLEVSPRRTLIEFLAAVQIADEDPDCVPHVVRKVDSERIKQLLEQEVKRRE